MAYNGSGTFNLYTPGNPVITGSTISSTWANATLSDLATGLTTAITKDGQTVTTGSIPFAAGASFGAAFVLDSSGNLAVTTNKFTVTAASGNTAVAGTLAVTGHTTFEGVTSIGATGTGKLVYDTSPTLVTPILGTPASGNLSACTSLPISTGVQGLGTGVATALAVNVGSAGAPVLFNGAAGTPTSGVLSNCTVFGYGQTWTDVTGSRAIDSTVYTNSTARPISVVITAVNNGFDFYIDSVKIAAVSGYGGVGGFNYSCNFIVPAGSTYKAVNSSATKVSWFELR